MSFLPIVSEQPKVLILGSMPGQKSLDIEQYYANPQNSFWWIMSKIIGFSMELNYLDRVAELQAAGVCVWDVLKDCDRKGSLDSNILRNSEVPNDIIGFLVKHSTISVLVFNGGASKSIFMRHNQLSNQVGCYFQLPSTSPAYASMKREQKLRLWHEAIKPHL